MAYFLRIIQSAIARRIAYVLVAALTTLLLGYCSNAKADYTVTTFEYSSQNDSTFHNSFTAACDATFQQGPAGANANYYYVSVDGSSSEPVCRLNVYQSSNYQVAYTLQKYKTCNGVRSLWSSGQGAGVCLGTAPIVCTPPQVINSAGTACETPTNNCLPNAGVIFDRQFTLNASTVICKVGCEMVVLDQVCAVGTSTGGCSSRVKVTGNTCTATPDQPETAPSDPMKECIAAGNSYGEVNGITTCVKNGTNGTPPLTQTVNDSKTVTNGSGTSSSTTTTTINGDTVTTTTTTVNNGGAPTTETKEQDKSGFCEENPTSKICKVDEESVFSGACSGGFICDGDAIQCATAKRIQQNKCDYETEKLTLESKTAYTTGNKLLNGEFDSDVQGFIDGTGDSTTNVNIGQLSENGDVSFGGEGMQNVSFTVQNRTVTLPLSDYNQYLEYMGYILLALAYMAAFKIVMGAT